MTDPVNDNSAPKPGGEDTRQQQLRCVNALAVQLRKAGTIISVFPANSPSYRKGIDELLKRFVQYHQSFGTLELGVAPDTFVFEGGKVGFAGGSTRFFGHRLYRDGIRQVTFEPGITRQEILDFLKLAGVRRGPGAEDTDTISVIVSQDFPHIKFLVSQEIFTEELITESSFEDQKESTAKLGFYAPLESDLQEMVEQIKQAVRCDTDQLTIELQNELDQGLRKAIDGMADTLMTVFNSRVEPDLKQVTLERLFGLAEEYFETDRFDAAVETLLKVSMLDDDYGQAIVTHLKDLWSEDLAERFAARLKGASGVLTPKLKQFLTWLGRYQFVKLCQLAVKVGDTTVLKDLLIEAAAGQPDQVFNLLKSCHNGRMVAVLCSVVGSLKDNRSVDTLIRLLPGQQPWVKTQVMEALAAIGDHHSRRVLEQLVNDPESWIRMAAVRALAEVGDTDTGRLLEAEVLRNEFSRRELIEQRVFYTMLLKLSSQSVNTIIRKVLRRRRLFGRGRARATKKVLVEVAAKLDDPSVARLLEEEALRLRTGNVLGGLCRQAADSIRGNVLGKTQPVRKAG